MISIVGSETLLGRDLREALSESGIRNVQLLGVQDELAITAEAGEPAVITPLDSERLQQSDVIFCAGSVDSTRKAYDAARGEATFIDLTFALEDLPAARLRAPVVQGSPVESRVHVLAHPASTAIASVLGALPGTIKHAVIQVFEPASERGQAGIHELQQQTTSLLSFRQMEKKVYDAQVGFAMVPRYGEDAPEQLQTVEQRIERHLASLLATGVADAGKHVPMPSLRVTQAPVFHGYSLSFWVEFDGERPDLAELSDELEGADIEVLSADLDAPTNIGAAGQKGITAGVIEADRNHPRAVWIWAVADNFRLLVDNALQVGKALLK